MAVSNVNEISSLINTQLNFQEKIEDCLEKLEALMTVATSANNFYCLHSEKTLHQYLSLVNDLLEEAAETNQESLKNFQRIVGSVFV